MMAALIAAATCDGGHSMFEAWLSVAMLAVESNNVIGLRLMRLAAGGSDAYFEAALMVQEKVAAALEAQTSFLTGGTAASVVERYREHVAANVRRLTA
jgi:hypothetical protein